MGGSPAAATRGRHGSSRRSSARCPAHCGHVRRVALLLGAVGSLAGALGACHDHVPTGPTPPPEPLLAFVSDRDGNPELYTMRGDGSDVRRLTHDPARDDGPAWAPDRRRLAFVSDRDGNAELYVVNADGTGLRQLTYDPANDGSPAWAPDGRRLAFVSDRAGGVAQLFVVDVDAGDAFFGAAVQLTMDAGPNLDPSWSPDGARLAYASVRDGGSAIYVINADATGAAPLDASTQPTVVERAPAWSPDGRSIAFTVLVPAPTAHHIRQQQLFVVRADGTGRRQLTTATNEYVYATDPTWSPDGQRIVVTSNRDAAQPELYSVATDGSDVVRLTRSAATFFSSPTWSPDGSRIAMLAAPAGFPSGWSGAQDGRTPPRAPATELYVVNRDGTGLRRLLEELDPGGKPPVWSPDGRRLALVSRGSTPTLLVVQADGSGVRRLLGDVASGADYGIPVWSPDGRRVALANAKGAPGMLVVQADGGGWTGVAIDVASGPVWSPDGAQLAFSGRRADDDLAQTYVVDSGGGGLTRLTQLDPTRDFQSFSPVDWSPDGATLLLAGTRTLPAGPVEQIFALDRASGAVAQLTSSAAPYDRSFGARYSPDGRRIAFLRTGGVHISASVMNADGTGLTWLNSGDVSVTSYTLLRWSPDSRRLAVGYTGFKYAFLPGVGVVNDTDGSRMTRLGGPCTSSFGPTWDESGSAVAFECSRDLEHELYVARLADGALTRLTHGSPTSSYGPTWTP